MRLPHLLAYSLSPLLLTSSDYCTLPAFVDVAYPAHTLRSRALREMDKFNI